VLEISKVGGAMKIHLIGIGGTGMASLAGLLIESGHKVTGSDGPIYPPMSEQLKSLNITPYEGYSESNIEDAKPKLVIIGNVIRKENPEAQEAMRRGIDFLSMPDALYRFFLSRRTPFVVAGTHGKTTSSNLMAWLMKSCELDPGFLIGGIGLNFQKSYSLGRDPFFVIEGDEYDSAFFDKNPKFLNYKPHALLLTSIEFDHADIYNDINQIVAAFSKLVEIVPPDGLTVANMDDPRVAVVVSNAKCRVVNYAIHERCDYHPVDIDISEEGTSFTMSSGKTKFTVPLWGEHNLSNTIGVLALLIESGQAPEKLAAGLEGFKGVRRRQEILSEDKGIIIVDDFAHHPTAVRKTIESMRLQFPGKRLWAIFEPRSNTSRQNIFKEEYTDALALADKVVISHPYNEHQIDSSKRLDVDEIAASILKAGKDAYSVDSTDSIVEFVMRGVDSEDVILVMSNGNFDNLCNKLIDALKKRRIVTDRSEISPSRVHK